MATSFQVFGKKKPAYKPVFLWVKCNNVLLHFFAFRLHICMVR